jgi:hypothetical protein
MNMKLAELKNICKEKADVLKQLTIDIKKTQQENSYAGLLQQKRVIAKLDYRHHHIAYCLLRGKLYEQIEKPKYAHTKLSGHDWETIETIRSIYYEQIEEAICIMS